MRIPGFGTATAIGLHHDFIDYALQAVQRRGVAGLCPVEQAGDAQAAVGGQLPSQAVQGGGVVGQMQAAGVKVNLDAG